MTAHALPTPLRNSLLPLGLIASIAALALAASGLSHTTTTPAIDTSNHVVEIGASYRMVSNLAELTTESPLVVVGHVVQTSTHMVAQPVQVQPFTQAPASSAPAAKLQLVGQVAQATPTPSAVKRPIALPAPGVPETTVTIQVSRVLRGTVAAGSLITVTQPGGAVTLPTYQGGPMIRRTFVFDKDPLMQAGQDQVLFLNKNHAGDYYVVGGPQGRFSIANGQIAPVDPSSPLARSLTVNKLDTLATSVEQAAN